MIPWIQIKDDPRRISLARLCESFDRGALEAKGGKRSLSSIHTPFVEHMTNVVRLWSDEKDMVVSIGCGSGELERRVQAAQRRVIALDMRPLSGTDDVPFYFLQGDAHALPLRNQTCECVLFSESIGQIVVEHAFAEAARVLVPGGHLILSTYALPAQPAAEGQRVPFPWAGSTPWMTSQAELDIALEYFTMGMYRLYPEGLLQRFLTEAGFVIQKRSCIRYAIGETGFTDILMLVAQISDD